MASGAIHVTPEYTSVACSGTPHSLDWGAGGRLCFGACNALAVAEPLPGGDAGFRTRHTLHHHTGAVTCLRWARDARTSSAAATVEVEAPAVLVTGSRDNTAAVWDMAVDPPTVAARLEGHTAPVTQVDVLRWSPPSTITAADDAVGESRLLVATTSGDCTLKLWTGPAPSQVALMQTIPLGRGLALALRLAQPPVAAAPWLFVGNDEAAVVIYAPGAVEGKENLPPTADAGAGGDAARTSAEYVPLLRLAGHEDWVRCLDATVLGKSLLLASAGQDAIIRVWSITPKNSAATGDTEEGKKEDVGELKVRSQSLCVPGACGGAVRFSVTLDSVLAGHEGWVCGLRWRPAPSSASPAAPQLASASMDRAALVWRHDPEAGVWIEAARLGSVGGTSLGLLGCAWSPDGTRLAAHGQRGALHVWAEQTNSNNSGGGGEGDSDDEQTDLDNDNSGGGVWKGQVPPGGHSAPVADLAWAPGGGYLLTTSADQTTRLHACWKPAGSWHEMGRPQVHGYDMSCVATITDYSFASGAEEKVARSFAMPGAVRDTLAELCDVTLASDGDGSGGGAALPEGAAVPSLGLTNKPVFAGEEQRGMVTRAEEGAESYFLRQRLSAPPAEETLLQNTLWPELMKLYGHGFELVTMAASHDGRILATACRAARPEHAAVLLWDTATWRRVGQLTGAHQLTVVQLAFSPDDGHLLAVSRDRTWSLWARRSTVPEGGDAKEGGAPAQGGGAEAEAPYQLCARGEKAHARIIWCCAWLNSVTFVTGSRDGQMLRWRRTDNATWQRQGTPYKPGSPVTAVAAASVHPDLCAVGLETGEIRIVRWTGDAWEEAAKLDTSAAHHGAVKRLQFRPCPQGGAAELLASCATDHAVKLHRVILNSDQAS